MPPHLFDGGQVYQWAVEPSGQVRRPRNTTALGSPGQIAGSALQARLRWAIGSLRYERLAPVLLRGCAHSYSEDRRRLAQVTIRGAVPCSAALVGCPLMDGAVPCLDRVAAIRAWSRSGVRAPHKPLLLLWALGRLQRNKANTPVPFADAEGPLRALLVEYGPPNRTSPGYPFHHLTNDGLWVVATVSGQGSPGPDVGPLRSQGAEGQLEATFAQALLADPGLLSKTARYLLDANFPATLHDDIADAVGLNLDAVTDGEVIDLAARRRRSPTFRADVLLAYEGRCAMCGWDGRLGGDSVGVEAAHIRWFTIEGPDSLDNGLCLCSLHHKLFDTGAIGITADRTVAVSRRFIGQTAVARALVHDLVGRPLEPPQPGLAAPADAHITWHTAQVFRQPARLSAC